MKTLKMLVALVVMFLQVIWAQEPVPVTPPTVQQPPEWLPFGSVGELQAYAWEQVGEIGLSAWSSSAVRVNGQRSDVWLNYNPTDGIVNVQEVLEAIGSQELGLSVLHTENVVNLYSGLYTEAGQQLFWGNSSVAVVLPRTMVDLELRMSQSIRFPFNGVSWFYIVERDANNNPVRYYDSSDWDARSGGFYFPAYFAGKSGEIVITLSDGNQVAYSLNNGKRVTPTKVQVVGGKVSALGTRTFVGQTVYLEVGKEEFEQNVSPLCQVTVPSDGYVNFAAWTGDWKGASGLEYASHVRVWAVGQRAGEWMEITTGTYLPLKLEKGLYWAEYWFKSGFGRIKNQFNPPYNDGGGKG